MLSLAERAAIRRGSPVAGLVDKAEAPRLYRTPFDSLLTVSQAIFFPDLSHYDLGRGVDIEPGTVAVIVKSTHGTRFVDSGYGPYKTQASAVGSYFTSYHWLNHGGGSAQAEYNIAQVGKVPVMVDAEDTSANTGYNGPLTVQDIVDFIVRRRQLGGPAVLVYLPHWYWADHMGSPDLSPLRNLGVGLVSSDYTTYSDTGPGWAGYGGMAPVQWQYTDALPYGGSYSDFNAFKGTLADYIALTGSGTFDASEVDMDANQARQLDAIYNRIFEHGWGGQSTFGRVNSDGTPATNFSQAIEGAVQAILTGDGKGAPINSPKVPASLASLAADLDEVKAAVATVQTGGVDLDALAAKMAPLIAPLIPAPPTAAEVAEEIAKRLGNG